MNAFGLGTLHFLWQGTVLAALLWAALRVVTGHSSRYWLSLATLAAMLGVFAGTVANGLGMTVGSGVGGGGDSIPVMVGSVWCAGVAVIALWHLSAWALLARRIRRNTTRGPEECVAIVARLRQRIPTLPVRVLRADWLTSPSVYGVLRPVLLIPAGLMTSMAPSQVEALLAHELAHIRRHDFLINLLQTAASTLLFFHPAAAWVNRTIRREREFCCDDVAIRAIGDRETLANALLELEERRVAVLTLGANEAPLTSRIARILKPLRQQPAAIPALAMLAMIAAVPLLVAQSEKLPAAYERWLREDVTYIIEKPEEAAFLKLKSDEERMHFIEQFWQRRNPDPSSSANPFKEEHYRRIAYANGKFADGGMPGWKTDKGRVYIQLGPPDELEVHPDRGVEQWMYRKTKYGVPMILHFEKKK